MDVKTDAAMSPSSFPLLLIVFLGQVSVDEEFEFDGRAVFIFWKRSLAKDELSRLFSPFLTIGLILL